MLKPLVEPGKLPRIEGKDLSSWCPLIMATHDARVLMELKTYLPSNGDWWKRSFLTTTWVSATFILDKV